MQGKFRLYINGIYIDSMDCEIPDRDESMAWEEHVDRNNLVLSQSLVNFKAYRHRALHHANGDHEIYFQVPSKMNDMLFGKDGKKFANYDPDQFSKIKK